MNPAMSLIMSKPRLTVFGLALWALGVLLLASCDKPAAPVAAPARTVLTSFYPTTYFAERIASGKVEVRCPCPPGEDPVSWKPSRADLAAYQEAGLIVLNGAAFEKWPASASLPAARTVSTAASFKDEFIRSKTVTHSHGPGGKHSHSGIDGHTWVDPVNAKTQAQAIRDAMSKAWPEHAQVFEAGFAGLAADLDGLDARCREVTVQIGTRPILTSHPAYAYIARRYGWKVVDLDVPPDEEPSESSWALVRDAVSGASEAPRVMLFESEPLPATRERLLREFKVVAVTFSPCESAEAGRDYLVRMRANLDALSTALVPAP
jgi:zinc transport system substrate-binding protein